jgi:hypothetical protein
MIGVVTMTALAEETNSTTTDTTTSTLNQYQNAQQFQGNMQMGDQGFGMGMQGRGHGNEMGPMGGMNSNIEVSSEYNATVNTILSSDTDVANLISQGYTVRSINPIIKSVIGADGTITTKASTATVIMQNGTVGIAKITIDITNAKVTYIETITRTIIDKTSS